MGKVLRFVLWTVGIAAVVAGVLRLVLFEVWTVPDDPVLAASVAPTLAAGDTVLVLTRGTPGFGDLVRCPDPEEPSVYVVGRIVGLAGDTVEVKGRTLRVNNVTYNATEACAEPHFDIEHPQTGHRVEMDCSRVEIGSGWHYRASIGGKSQHHGDKEKKVGPGKVFLLSDNRDMHDDSRDFGTLEAGLCGERIVFRLWGSEGFGESSRRFEVVR
jgi:signal peptidase I